MPCRASIGSSVYVFFMSVIFLFLSFVRVVSLGVAFGSICFLSVFFVFLHVLFSTAAVVGLVRRVELVRCLHAQIATMLILRQIMRGEKAKRWEVLFSTDWPSLANSQTLFLSLSLFLFLFRSSNRGVDNQVDMCKAANIPGFPTWDIDGKLYPGEQTLEELEEIVGLSPSKG